MTVDRQQEISAALRNFSRNLKLLRDRRGMTQEDLAKALGVSAAAVGNWESGQNRAGVKHLPKIAQALGVSVDYLLGRLGDRTDSTLVLADQPSSNPVEEDCREHLEAFLVSCDGKPERLGWTLVELRDHFRLDRWAKAAAVSSSPLYGPTALAAQHAPAAQQIARESERKRRAGAPNADKQPPGHGAAGHSK